MSLLLKEVKQMKKQLKFGAIVLLGLVAAACAKLAEDTIGVKVNPQDSTVQPDVKPSAQPSAVYYGDWTNNILSEARYTLNPSRSGTSNLTYNGQYMGDWNWPTGGSDNWAFQKVSADYAGATGTVGFSRFEQGGWCKFFVSLVLFRCSYGLGNNYHLYLPYGYIYATIDPRNAGPGWVLQSTMPHTAIIDSPHYNSSGVRDGWWVIDSNWIGTYKNSAGQWVYSYWVGKHWMSFSSLDANKFKAELLREGKLAAELGKAEEEWMALQAELETLGD
jgi:hypothetical protein